MLNKFIPESPDPFLKKGADMAPAKFGHLNEIVREINAGGGGGGGVITTKNILWGLITNFATGNNPEFVDWAGTLNPTGTHNSCLPIPFDLTIKRITLKYLDTTSASVDALFNYEVSIGKLTNPSGISDNTNYTDLTGGANVLTLTNANVNGTHFLLETSGLNIVVSAGDVLLIKGFKTLGLATGGNNEEVMVSVEYEKNYASSGGGGGGGVTSLTTTGSGAATLVGSTLNVPTPAASPLLTTTATLTAADLLAAAGITILPAPAATKYYVLHSVAMKFKAGSVAFDQAQTYTFNMNKGVIDKSGMGVQGPTSTVVIPTNTTNQFVLWASGIMLPGNALTTAKVSGPGGGNTPSVGDSDVVFDVTYELKDF